MMFSKTPKSKPKKSFIKSVEKINSDVAPEQRHREYLKLYGDKGLRYTRSINESKEAWADNYTDDKFSAMPNLIERLPNVLVIEFDNPEGESMKPSEALEIVEKQFKKSAWAYFKSTHKGKCDYLWIEFSAPISEDDAKRFLSWICPAGARIDLNFASRIKVFPVLFAPHRKHPHDEMPVYFVDGKKINFDSLKIPKAKPKTEIKKSADGYSYETLEKGKPVTTQIDFSIENLIDKFLDQCPVFYDKNKILWGWNPDKFSWEIIDSIDIRVSLNQGFRNLKSYYPTILERARMRIPKIPKPTWIQFKSKIYDFADGTSFDATPEYFITNPIPYDLPYISESGEIPKTPKIDKLFSQWITGDVEILYEIIAYSMCSNKFMQRLFAFVGAGANGKTTFVSLIKRLLGNYNCVATELRLLSERNFETAIIYKRLLAIIGEVGYDDLSNTSQLKKLSGEDDIRFEFKGKQPFSDKNTATILCCTNSLPRSPDKSTGFYRRWFILDFPNQFPVGKNPVDSISEEEMQFLALKCFRKLMALWQNRKFTGEGTIEDRERIYEEKSNPLLTFLNLFCEDTPGEHIPKRKFCTSFNSWLRDNHQRPLSTYQISRMLKDNGYDIGSRKIEGESAQVITNCSFLPTENEKIPKLPQLLAKSQLDLYPRKTSVENSSSYGSYGNQGEIALNNPEILDKCAYCQAEQAIIFQSGKALCKSCAYNPKARLPS